MNEEIMPTLNPDAALVLETAHTLEAIYGGRCDALRSLADRMEGAGDVAGWLLKHAERLDAAAMACDYDTEASPMFSAQADTLREAIHWWQREHQGKEAGE